MSRGSLIEIDAALDIVVDLDYSKQEKLTELGKLLLECFKMLSSLISKNN